MGGRGPGHTYTMASLGHSAEVLYHPVSLLSGMAPLKYSRQHSRPTLVARAVERGGRSRCVCECLWGVWGGPRLWRGSLIVHVPSGSPLSGRWVCSPQGVLDGGVSC